MIQHTLIFPAIKQSYGVITVSIIFKFQIVGSNTTAQAHNEKLYIKNLGTLDLDIKPLEFMLNPAVFMPTFYDAESYLYNLINNSIFADTLIEEPTLDMLIAYNNQTEENLRYNMVMETIDFNKAEKILKIDFRPPFNKLNQTVLFDSEGNPSNPFNYNLVINNFLPLPTVLLDIFKLVNPFLTDHTSFILDSPLTFMGYKISDITVRQSFSLDELLLDVHSLYFQNYGQTDLASILRLIAASLGLYCGFTGWLPFLHGLEVVSPTVVIDPLEVLNEYSKKTAQSFQLFKVNNLIDSSQNWQVGNHFAADELTISQDVILYANDSYYNMQALKNGEWYHIYAVRDRNVSYPEGEHETTNQYLIRKWQQLSNVITANNMTELTVRGVNYSMFSQYSYKSIFYFCIGVKRDLDASTTTLRLVK